jgi:hypothetical protein
MFWQLVERYPESPWRPWAILASGLLLSEAGDGGSAAPAYGTGVARLLELVDADPDHPSADSARRALGLEVPERPSDFYATDPTLAALSRVMPPTNDPMLGIEDQMDRYGARSRARAPVGEVPPEARSALRSQPLGGEEDPLVDKPRERQGEQMPSDSLTSSDGLIEP